MITRLQFMQLFFSGLLLFYAGFDSQVAFASVSSSSSSSPFHAQNDIVPAEYLHDIRHELHVRAGILSINESMMQDCKCSYCAYENPLDISSDIDPKDFYVDLNDASGPNNLPFRRLQSFDHDFEPEGDSSIVHKHSNRHHVMLSTGRVASLRLPSLSGLTQAESNKKRVLSYRHPRSFATATLSNSSVKSCHHWILHTKGPSTLSSIQSLQDVLNPYVVHSYMPHNSWLLIAPENVAVKARMHPLVLYIAEMPNEWKFEDTLLTMIQSRLKSGDVPITLTLQLEVPPYISTFHDVTSKENEREQLSEDFVITDRLASSWNEFWHDSLSNWLLEHSHHSLQLLFGRMDQSRISLSINYTTLPDQHLFEEEFNSQSVSISSFTAFLLHSLSRHPYIHYISSRPSFQLYNYYAKWVTQSTSYNWSVPAYDLGLDGTDQIIAMGDTGVDYDSCFFFDPKTPVPVNTINRDHRKIIAYITSPNMKVAGHPLAAPGDHVGHGTHTAGTVSGAVVSPEPRKFVPLDALNELSRFNGIAYRSKLVIHDFHNEGDPTLYVPNDVYNEYLTKVANIFGAHISSNSWGDDQGVYDDYSQSVDRFLHRYPYHTMVMAAGNEGLKGRSTIGTPACAKNVLTVGSALNHPDSFGELGYNTGIQIVEPPEWRAVIHVTPADFGQPFYHFRTTPADAKVALAIPEPRTACSPLLNADEIRGKVVITERGGDCYFYTKALNIQNAGGLAMLVANSDSGGAFPMPFDKNLPDELRKPDAIPCAMIALEHGKLLTRRSNKTILLKLPVPYLTEKYNVHRMSSFSARGPTLDGRIKPDLLAPGEFIQSAKSTRNLDDYQCSPGRTGRTIEALEGTSMATPVASGTAALIRQFFVEGKYKSYFVNRTEDQKANTSFIPTASLLKAMLAHSAVAVDGTVHENRDNGIEVKVPPPPSVYQGHGRIQLDQVIPFPYDQPNRPFSLFVDDKTKLQSLETARYCFMVKYPSTIPVKATLAWIDPPGLLHSSYLLINQFDLLVSYHNPAADDVNATRRVWIGNDISHDDGSPMQWDTNNNLEKIVISKPNAGIYQVVVRATHLPYPSQPYSLVVTGNFEMMGAAECNTDVFCPNMCSGHGACHTKASRAPVANFSLPLSSRSSAVDGKCVCGPHYAAADCSVTATQLTVNSEIFKFSIIPNTWHYLYYDAQPTDGEITFVATRLSSFGDPDFYLTTPSVPGYPTLAYAALNDTQYDPHMKDQPNPKHYFVISETEVMRGTYMLGVWGYCCEKPEVGVIVYVKPRVSLALAPTQSVSDEYEKDTPVNSKDPLTSIPSNSLPISLSSSPNQWSSTSSPSSSSPTTDDLTSSLPSTANLSPILIALRLHLLKESLPKLPSDDQDLIGVLLSYQFSYLIGLTHDQLESLEDIKTWYTSAENCIHFVDKRSSYLLGKDDQLVVIRLFIMSTKSTTLVPSDIAQNIISLYTSRSFPPFLENAVPLGSVDWSTKPRTCLADQTSPRPRCVDEDLEHVLMLSLFPNSLVTTYEVLSPISHSRTGLRVIIIVIMAMIAGLGMMTCILYIVWQQKQSRDVISFQAFPDVDNEHTRNDQIHSSFDIHHEVEDVEEEEDDDDLLHEHNERKPLTSTYRY